MPSEHLKIPKTLKQVTLWVHPEGRVIGHFFVRKQSLSKAGQEEPIEVLNTNGQFMVLQRESPHELRFYNISCIIRVEYTEKAQEIEIPTITCRMHLMDGSIMDGSIKEPLPPDKLRLFDFLNIDNQRFIKLRTSTDTVCLINKAYINYVTDNDSDQLPT